ncbi:MAG: GlsB/YeaQ/YmgE family stress response membrane protein [Actinomycetota bacterium]|jgi:uncharacterized membrane protein YeaQ/YmgE (transglycosylase-associated protein family)|nr:GlsB/YeaQ/YmgE family stress response membrane protein [Actinomycetota bacterium]
MIGRIIGLILVGLVVGGLGRLVHPGRDPMPIWLTIVIGIAAALVAGLLIGGILGFILAVVIAAVLVAVVGGMYRGRGATI